MPKQDKKKAKMCNFVFLEVARFARSKQAGNPLVLVSRLKNLLFKLGRWTSADFLSRGKTYALSSYLKFAI